MEPSDNYLQEIYKILKEISQTQILEIKKVSKLCANCITKGGLVHLFATGHSRVAVEEMFPRYGSFPGFHPIIELSLTHNVGIIGSNGQRQALFLEDVEGFGKIILENFSLKEPDVMIIFSNSGTHKVTIEIAVEAKRKGLPIIAIISTRQAKELSKQKEGLVNLCDIADFIIDTCSPPGDALVKIDGLEDLVGPSSTIASVAVANALKCEIAFQLTQAGFPPQIFVNPFWGKEKSRKSIEKCYIQYQRGLVRLYSDVNKE